jgi:hypothetical protein
MPILTLTDVQIANNALAFLGETKTVTSVTVDATNLGVLVADFYAATVDEELMAYPWVFSIVRQPITLAAGGTNGYPYRCAYPILPICLRVLDCYAIMSGQTQYAGFSINQTLRFGYVVEGAFIYTLFNPGTGTTCYVKYVSEVTASTSFPMQFCDVLSLRLAHKLALPVTHDISWQERIERVYILMIQRAAQMNLIETMDNDLMNPWWSDRRPWEPTTENRQLSPKLVVAQAVAAGQAVQNAAQNSSGQ